MVNFNLLQMKRIAVSLAVLLLGLAGLTTWIHGIAKAAIHAYTNIDVNIGELENYVGLLNDMYYKMPVMGWEMYKDHERFRLHLERRIAAKLLKFVKNLKENGQIE